ncbi:hypothetical protein BJV77DRAFT_966235 [Russula vinacea]|nr:hypothetical protein BJV77DRAFT_966235 [Russula vinacea]
MSPPQSSVPMRRQPDSVATKLTDWCYSCMDGGNLLACDLCERVICTMRCLEIPISFEELEKSSSSYRFLYFGLYKGRFTNNLDTNIKAFPNQPTKILGPFFLTYAAAQHNSKSLVILHFTLETINTEGSSANVVHQFLQPFFSSGSLLLEEVKFNIFDEEDADAHANKMEHLAGTISRKHRRAPVWLFITTHGDKDRGDLFYNTKAANFVDTFFDMVLTESIMDVLRTRSTMCFMMVCGGLVTFPESQRDLIKVFNSLLIDMSQRVILESYDISNFIGNLINSSPIITRHTSIIHLCITEKGTSSVQYLWAHKAIQPWGKCLPPQCDKCGSFQSWDKPVHVPASGANRVRYSFRCTGTTVNGSECMNVLTFYQPEGVIEVKNGWMTLPWPSTF